MTLASRIKKLENDNKKNIRKIKKLQKQNKDLSNDLEIIKKNAVYKTL